MFHMDSFCSEMASNLSTLHYDNVQSADKGDQLDNMPTVPPRPVATPETRTMSAKSSNMSEALVKTPATMKTFEMPLQPMVREDFLYDIFLCSGVVVKKK